jgi:hypothetical protein
MIKWPNDQMTKRRDRRSESAQSDSKAYGTCAVGKNKTENSCRPTAAKRLTNCKFAGLRSVIKVAI